VIDVVEILEHWHAGRSKMAVAASVGVNRETVRRYVAPAEAAGLVPGGPRLSRAEWAGLVAGWFPQLVDAKARSLTFPVINEHRERIEAMLQTNTVTTVHHRLRDEHGLVASIASFRRYVRLEFCDHVDESQVTVLRPMVEPGSEAQIDYGFLGPWVDPATQRARRVWAFVMVLACCRHMFVRPVLRMDIHAWIAAHVAAFEFFGAVPARLVTDNLNTGVIKADVFDPKLNRAYAELAEHYGCLIDPARALRPKDKPRVERPMPYIRDSFWRGRAWHSLDQMQTAATLWSTTIAGRRPHRGLEGAAPVTMFDAVSRPVMRALPHHRFEIAVWSRPKVASDCHISVAGVLYSVPWRYLGRQLDVRLTERRVEVFDATVQVKLHARAERGRRRFVRVLSEQRHQGREPRQAGVDPKLAQRRADIVDHGDVMMSLGPVDPAGDSQVALIPVVVGGAREPAQRPNGQRSRGDTSPAGCRPSDWQDHRLHRDLEGRSNQEWTPASGSVHTLAHPRPLDQ